MNKQDAVYPALAAALGLRYDILNNVIYGKRGEYDILIYAENKSAPYALTIHTAAERPMTLTKEEFEEMIQDPVDPVHRFLYGQRRIGLTMEEKAEYTGELKQIATIRQEGFRIIVQQKAISNQEKLQASLVQSVESLLSFLRAKGFRPCCSNCGQNAEMEPYQIDGSYMHLCPNCVTGMRGNMAAVARQEQSRKENMVTGTVGALLGSLFGLLCIVLLRRVNFVAAGSGVIMAVGVLLGYERFGKKLTKKGIVIGVVIMLVMTYVGDRLDWTIRLYNAVKPELTFFECYRMIPILLQEGVIKMSNYIYNLVMLYIFLLVGAAPIVIGAASEDKPSNRIVKIGSADFYNN